MTQGAHGSLALTRDGPTCIPARPVTVVDTVGAGDAFTVGLLDALATAQLLGTGHCGGSTGRVTSCVGWLDHAPRLSA